MLIEQIFELRRPGPLGTICTSKTNCFHNKTIIFEENTRLNCYLLLKYFTLGAMHFTSPPTWAKSLTKFNTKMQYFKRVLLLNC